MVIERIPQAAPAAFTADIEGEIRRIKRTLQVVDDQQALRLAYARLACSAVENEPLLREDAMAYADLKIALSDIALKPPTIAIMGQSGRGKSTLNSALIGRGDIQQKASGKPLTGCVSRTFTDIDAADGGEYAILQLRTAAEIKALVEKQVKKLGVKDFRVPDDVESLPETLNALSIGIENGEQTLNALLDIVTQFIRHADTTDRRIDLDSRNGRQRLHDLIREDSAQNSDPEQRMVDIVKFVDIHLVRLVREDDKHLELPENTCIVDTFGSGGSTTHTWGLEELLNEGNIDLLLFCVNPRRVTETEFEFARTINTAIRAGTLHRTQILMIHNAIDEEIQHGESETAIAELMHVLSGENERFEIHETSALAALWALEARNGVPNPEKYKSMAIALGVDPDVWDLEDPALHTAVYQASGLPALISEINALTRAYTVEVRVKAAETSVGKTVSRLSAHYNAEHERLAKELSKHGSPDVNAVKVLAAKKSEAKAYIAEKRAALLELLESEPAEKLNMLYTDARETLQTRLGETLPKLWDDNNVPDRLRTAPMPILHRPLPRSFVSDIEEWTWQELDVLLQPIGRYFADRIDTAFDEEACQELQRIAFETPVAEDVMSVETVREMTRKIGEEISDFAKNIGKAMLGQPKYRLIPSARRDNDAPSPVVKILETLAKTHDADAENFEALRDAICEQYDPGIKAAVAAIRGFHEAKLSDVERAFGDLIFQTFIRLQDTRETLGARLFDADESHALHLQKQNLDEKRTRLKTIETLMTTDTDASAS